MERGRQGLLTRQEGSLNREPMVDNWYMLIADTNLPGGTVAPVLCSNTDEPQAAAPGDELPPQSGETTLRWAGESRGAGGTED